MAGKGHQQQAKKISSRYNSSSYCSFLFLFLLSVASLFLIFSFFRASSKSAISLPDHGSLEVSETERSIPCDFSDGVWIHDPKRTARYDDTCKEIFKGWSCISNNKLNARNITKWRWKPKQCDLPTFDPVLFLERYRHTKIGFVGDSLNRNMFVSFVCTLKGVTGHVKKWRPAGADRGFTFLQYNLTIAYHRTNLLARYGGLLVLRMVP